VWLIGLLFVHVVLVLILYAYSLLFYCLTGLQVWALARAQFPIGQLLATAPLHLISKVAVFRKALLMPTQLHYRSDTYLKPL